MEKRKEQESREKDVLCLIDEMVKARGEMIKVRDLYGIMDENSTTNCIVEVGNETWIGVCELGGALEEDRLREATGKLLDEERMTKVVYFLIYYQSTAVLLSRRRIRKISGIQKFKVKDIGTIIGELERKLFDEPSERVDVEEAEKYIITLARGCKGLSAKKRRAIEDVGIQSVEQIEDRVYFTLDDKSEQKMLSTLLGSNKFSKVCRYTSLDSLMRIVSEQKISLCSIVGMNDRSECSYAAKKIGEVRDSAEAGEMLDKSDSCFIMSCVEEKMKDDLTMWRLYGDDGKGVCLTFNVRSDEKEGCEKKNGDEKEGEEFKMAFAKVSYAREDNKHPELDFIRELLYDRTDKGHGLRLKYKDVWEHFFKPHEYASENETRLLVRKKSDDENDGGEVKWIKTYSDGIICKLISYDFRKGECKLPIELESVMLGPKCPESDINVVQLKRYIESQNLNISQNFKVEKSTIKTYR